MKVKRVFVEKRPGFNIEALKLRSDLANFLGVRYPALARLARVRILNRYDAGWTQPTSGDDAQFETIVNTVFSEAQCDDVFYSDAAPAGQGDLCFATEYLGGQYNQRSDSARQCAELVEPGRILIRQALVYILTPGDIPVSDDAFAAVKNYLINPVDSHEARAELPESLIDTYSIPGETPLVHGFISGAASSDNVIRNYGLAMSVQDLDMCRTYFSAAGRDPTLAELKVLDTYWSDHCRHTTFNTVLEKIDIPDGPYGQDLRKAIALYEAARKEVYDADSRAAAHPPSLMDMAVIGAKVLKKRGLADDVDESAEVNACTLKINAEFSGDPEFSGPWLLLFKNETHNHPTEIEPFGGAATCLGGAIRDPLSGRAYVYQSMRVTGGADPRVPLDETLPGKLPQIKIARDASAGFASYGNQIGLATGQVAEFYHPGFLAKRMELGAVIAAVPASAVRREEPVPGDLVILVGGKTGRDGIGGATGSSKIHSGESVGTAGAEVQKGNAVEERKLQRLFRNPKASRLIRRCNDFGAGGVAVAVGELAAGLDIDLDKVPKKYAGLNGVELAISESQERMAVVVSAADAQEFIDEAARENLDALVIAEVTAGGSDSNAVLHMKWQGKTIVELSRNFLDSNGASRSACALLPSGESLAPQRAPTPHSPLPTLLQELQSLRSCSRRGLQERFDGSIGAGSVLFPWGGKTQGTPECGMAALIPSLDRQSRTASLMAFGYDPYVMSKNPYLGAKGSIREALAKIACMGGNPWKARLSLQEYFGRPQAPETWGLPASALLGALEAQLTLGVPAIGGKDSMSGNYRDLNSGTDITVPPTLVAFAAGTIRAERVRSGALSEDSGRNGNVIILFAQKEKIAYNEWDVFKANINALVSLGDTGCVRSAYPVVSGGIAASLALMAFGNNTGVEVKASVLTADLGSAYQGSMLAEIDGPEFRNNPKVAEILGASGNWTVAATAIPEPFFRITNDNCAGGAGVDAQSPGEIALAQLREAWEQPLATVYPPVSTGIREQEGIRDQGSGIRGGSSGDWGDAQVIYGDLNNSSGSQSSFQSPIPNPRSPIPSSLSPNPLVILPVFPGTNCEYDMDRAFRKAGARTRIIVFRNRNRDDIEESLKELASAIADAQILALSGGFSAGDEPDGSGKYIANVLRSQAVSDAIGTLLDKNDGLILGICNGFQALIKTGLVPYGSIRRTDAAMPTLTFNRVGRHVSRMVHTRVMSRMSPWLSLEEDGAVHIIPVSHGEGRVVMRREEAQLLFQNGQIPFCYTDARGKPTLDEPDNPNGSDFAIEGLSSPDGRILGKMSHSERCGDYVHINIPGNKKQNIFEAGVKYFKK